MVRQVFLLSFFVFLSACSLDATISDISKSFPSIVEPEKPLPPEHLGHALAKTGRLCVNDEVFALKEFQGKVAVGGDFNRVGYCVEGGSFTFKASNGAVSQNQLPKVEKDDGYYAINSIVSDGHGGKFVAGVFDKIGGQSRRGFAQVNSDGSIGNLVLDLPATGWYEFSDLLVHDDMLFLGGNFPTVNGMSYPNLAVFDLNTNLLVPAWNLNIEGGVFHLEIASGKLILTGNMSLIGSVPCGGVAIVDLATKAVECPMTVLSNWGSFDPSVTKVLNNKLYVSQGSISYAGENSSLVHLDPVSKEFSYASKVVGAIASVADFGSGRIIGGSFISIDGQNISNIAKLDSSGRLVPWAVTVNGSVTALAVQGTTLYLAGDFSQVNGTARAGLAAVDLSSDTLLPWATTKSGTISKIIPDGSNVWLFGDFVKVGTVDCGSIARVDNTTGATVTCSKGFNNIVNDAVSAGSEMLVAGEFTNYAAMSKAKLFNGSTLNVSGGAVRVSVSDGSGGWIFGGDFTDVNGSGRSFLARVNSSGTVQSLNVSLDGPVRALALSGSTLYVGGDFLNAGGQARPFLFSVDVNTNVISPWTPMANGRVRSILLTASYIFVGGDFTSLSSQTRQKAGAFNVADGSLNVWDPQIVGQSVRTIKSFNAKIYFGGEFTSFAGQTRNAFAAIDESALTLESAAINLSSSGWINDIDFYSGKLYLGGSFRVGRANNFGVYEISTNTLSECSIVNSNINAEVTAVKIDSIGSNIFIGGYFRSGGYTHFANVYMGCGSAVIYNWVNGPVHTFSYSTGNTMFMGGDFTVALSGNDPTLRYLVRINKTTMAPVSVGLLRSESITKLASNPGGGYDIACGSCNIGALSGVGVATIASDYSNATMVHAGWASNFYRSGNDIYLYNGSEILRKDTIGGTEIQIREGAATGVLNIFELSGQIYFSGSFSFFPAMIRKGIVEFDLSSGSITGWVPPHVDLSFEGAVEAIEVNGSDLLVSVQSTDLGAAPGAGVLRFPASNMNQPTLILESDAVVRNILAGDEGHIYLTGEFASITQDGVEIPRTDLAQLRASDYRVTSWKSNAYSIYGIFEDSDSILAYGGYELMTNTMERIGLAAFDLNKMAWTDWKTEPIYGVFSLEADDKFVYIGTDDGGDPLGRPTALFSADAWTGAITDWNPEVDNMVETMVLHNNTLYVGGWFSSIGGQTRYSLASVDLSTKSVTSWAPNPSDGIYDMEIYKNRLLVGGEFNNIDGISQPYFAEFDLANNAVRTSFNPEFDYTPLMLTVRQDKLIASGWFDNVGALARHGLAEIDLTNGSVGPLNITGSPGDYWSVVASDSDVFLIGEYYDISGLATRGFAKIDRTTSQVTTSANSYNNSTWHSPKPFLNDKYLIFGLGDPAGCNYLCVVDPMTNLPKE